MHVLGVSVGAYVCMMWSAENKRGWKVQRETKDEATKFTSGPWPEP